MERHQYIEMIKTGNFGIELFYEYYCEMNEKEEFTFSINEFLPLFNQHISLLGTNNAVNTVRRYYDNKFTLRTLLDKNKNIIQYY